MQSSSTESESDESSPLENPPKKPQPIPAPPSSTTAHPETTTSMKYIVVVVIIAVVLVIGIGNLNEQDAGIPGMLADLAAIPLLRVRFPSFRPAASHKTRRSSNHVPPPYRHGGRAHPPPSHFGALH